MVMSHHSCSFFAYLSLVLILVQSDTVYISESQSLTLCNHEDVCMTLSEFLDSYSVDNVELEVIFLPGNYALNSTIFSLNDTPFVTLKSSTGESSRHIINCHMSTKFKFKFQSLVNISGLTLNGCLDNEVSGVESFIMEDCRVKGDKEKSGRALMITNSTAHIVRSHFTSFNSYKGGALSCSLSNVSMLHCNFTDSRATNGGVLHVESSSFVTIEKCLFLNNMAHSDDFGDHFIKSTTMSRGCSGMFKNYHQDDFCTSGGTIYALESDIVVHLSTFTNNNALAGGVVYCINKTRINISNSTFSNNKATVSGGVIHQLDCLVSITTSSFYNNSGKNGGVLYHNHTDVTTSECLKVEDSYFSDNTAVEKGGVVFISSSNVSILGCQFHSNKAQDRGGALFVTADTYTTITSVNFTNNTAKIGGALRVTDNSTVFVSESTTFMGNSADYGAAIHFDNGYQLTFKGNISIVENNASVGVIRVIDSTFKLCKNVLFSRNFGSLSAFRSKVTLEGNVTFTGNNLMVKLNIRQKLELKDGCITIAITILNICRNAKVSIVNNTAQNGGGILAISSAINIRYSDLSIHNNLATDTGGGVYLYQSTVYFRSIANVVNISNNKAYRRGGGIHAISSSIILHNKATPHINQSIHLFIIFNTADKGGGVYLEVNSRFLTTTETGNGYQKAIKDVHLVNNSAESGGAIYVADNTIEGTCSSIGLSESITAKSQSQCFFQFSQVENKECNVKFTDIFSFENNSAQYGPLLFGGLLDRCTMSSFTGVNQCHVQYSKILGYSDGIANYTSSLPVRVCICRENGTFSEFVCNEVQKVSVMKGELIQLCIVAVDQMNHSVNATIHSYLSNYSSGTLEKGQKEVNIQAECTLLNFTIKSQENHEDLLLHAKGPCKDKGISTLNVTVNFIPCKCHAGFEVNDDIHDRCECSCDKKLLLLPYIKKSYCISTNFTIERSKKYYWISIVNETIISSEYCPSDYCHPSMPPIYIDLGDPNGADVQCNFNRTGKLCGKCQEGLAFSLSSSRCVECPEHWPVIFTFVTLGFVLIGLLMVVFLLITNLTVASGSLNGVIFYANIIGANQDLFMPFQHTNFHTVFIHWLNLNFAFDYCFLKNMDAYVSSWLQLTFPVYLILIVVAVMIFSKYSARFAKLIGHRNPIATLATLVLVSYTKLLQSVITVLSFGDMYYIHDVKNIERVWLYDASVLYLKGKHIPLFIVAVFIVLLGICYTALLLFWQLLIRLPNRAIFRWVRNTKLSSFIDAYHAPFTARHRYWTGVLLLARVVLHLTAAVNVSGKHIDLLAVSLVVVGILLLQGYSGINIYKKWALNVFEFTSSLNILTFCIAKYYVLFTDEGHLAIAYVSVTVEFILFLCIIVYHSTVKFKIQHRIKKCIWYKSRSNQDLNIPFLSNQHQSMSSVSQAVTYSEVSMKGNCATETFDTDDKCSEQKEVTQLFD